MELTDLPIEDLEDLREAKRKLEHPSLTSQISNLIGKPIESLVKRLPPSLENNINKATKAVLLKSLEAAEKTFGPSNNLYPYKPHNNLHKAAVLITGGIGGAFGITATLIELPVTTTIILRSIVDIAKSEEFDAHRFDVQLACIEVFALGGSSTADDASETGYWVTRGLLSRQVAQSTSEFISRIAARFSVQISEEIAAKAVPIVGAISGSAINVLFMNHFQNIAQGHFVVKRLENKYGSDTIQKLYKECPI